MRKAGFNKGKLEAAKSVFFYLILPVLIFLVWLITTENKLINPTMLPSPKKVWNSFLFLAKEGSITRDIAASFSRVIKGYLIGSVSALILGFLIGLFFRLNQMFKFLIGLLRPIPPIALIPLFILWLGIGEKSKIAIIVIGSFWPVLINTISGISGTDKKLIEVAEMFEKNKLEIVRKIVLPYALPSIFCGLRLGISTAWSCVVASEMIAASEGIGYLIIFAREMSKPGQLFTGLIIIGLIGLIIDLLFIWISKKVIYWEN